MCWPADGLGLAGARVDKEVEEEALPLLGLELEEALALRFLGWSKLTALSAASW